MKPSSSKAPNNIPEFLVGGGELGQRIREYDWSKTSLGPVESWPRSLRTSVQIMLTSRQPIWIGWGKELIKLYNDPYKTIVGGKHPWALGKPASEVWKDIWKDIDPMLQQVMHENEGTYVESQLLIMERNGYQEETYYTFSYTPIAGDEGGTEGMICFNTDDTDRIISERQLRTLTQLGKILTNSKNAIEVFQRAVDTIKGNPHDFPFALLYVLKNEGLAELNSTTFETAVQGIPLSVQLQSSEEIAKLFNAASKQRKHQLIENLQNKIGVMPSGVWQIPPDKAVILPIAQSGQKEPYGFLIIGLNPFRLLDDKYLSFFELVADQIATSIGNVFSLEEERKRLEALAEIDRAKTTFFSNISHEFRTPLTLLLGPMEDLMNDRELSRGTREKADVAFRNALRMQKLVNMLLDFSRIEAGKMEAQFTPVDIVSVTRDLASNFRSAIEKAGMKLDIKAEKIDQPVSLDIDMWEKIILNLLSNAFKYSDSGLIEVSISKNNSTVEVAVKDHGIGIPASEIDRIFERFHRVQNTGGRSQEGTGIGLAMVKELVKLHGGTITVKSVPGEGSVFTVSLPLQNETGKTENAITLKTKESSALSTTYLEEALQWIPETTVKENSNGQSTPKKFTVLLADDNADMRRYVLRLLENDYRVVAVEDGEQAFNKAIEYIPDLILSDIMMPNLDGFGLLKKLKSNLTTRNIPVIFLSARAGEEAKVEGINAGADDYLTKPFSSKELLARVSNHIAISSARRKTEKEFYKLFLQSPAHIHVMKGPEHIMEFFHPLGIPFAGKDITGMKIREALPRMEGLGFFEILDQVYKEGITIHLKESKVSFTNAEGNPSDHYFNITYMPYLDIDDHIQGVLQFTIEVTDTVELRLKAEESEKRFRDITQQAPVAMAVFKGSNYVTEVANERALELWGKKHEEVIDHTVAEIFPELAGQGIIQILDDVFRTGKPFIANELPVKLNRGGVMEELILSFIYEPLRTKNNVIEGIVTVGIDVTDQVNARNKVAEAEARFRLLATSIPQIVWTTDEKGDVNYVSEQFEKYTGQNLNEALATWGSLVHPEDVASVDTKWSASLQSGEPWSAEYRLRNINTGAYRWFLGHSSPFKNEDGEITMWIGSASDIQNLKEQSNWLEEQIQERTKALKELNQSLKVSNEDLQQFAHVASHDLKEPIRKIKTYSNRLMDEYHQLLPEKGSTFLSKILSATDRMYSMVDGVLSYSTLTAVDQPIESVDLNEVMKNIQLDLEVLIQEKKAIIKSDQLPAIQGSPVLLYQLFYNLVNNSIKFSKVGVTPVIDIHSSAIEKEGMHFLEITLSDNGIGFEQEYAEQIFTTFTRLNSKDKYEGTGLGLALCKKIVQRHGGSISATAEKNKGAEFIILLPVE